jgi:solute carrier family 13 (sodium-dependent dicarboxylate transporter), member 2/3/5
MMVWKKAKNILYMIIALGIMLIVMKLPLPESITGTGDAQLTPLGRNALGILLFALILWITEVIPFHITGLLGVFMMALFGVDSFKNVVKMGFGNDIVMFFIGVLILSSFISRSGFGKRISMFILSKTGNNTAMIILGFLVAGTVLSMWVTDMAVAAMLMPLGRAILQEQKVKPLESNFGKALMIACAWGPIIGGIGTPAGCGPNPLAIGFLKDMAGIDVSFIDWMIYGVPSAIMLILPSWAILLLFFKPEMKKLSKSKGELKEDFKNMPRMEREEKVTVIIFLMTVILWLISPLLEKLLGIGIPVSMPVLLTSIIFFFPGVSKIKWKEVEPEISWSGIILILSGISLGMMVYNTGAAKWLSMALLGGVGDLHPFVQIFSIVFIVSLLKVGLSSNTVTATIVIPIIIALAQSLGLPVMAITLPAALTSSLAFILVTSTPTNVIPYSAGYFSISDMAKAGSVLTVVSSLIMAGTVFVIGSLRGLY